MFEEHMRYLYEHGYRNLPLEDLISLLAKNSAPVERSFVVTFDDGNEDFLSQAYPILRRFRFTATVFLVTEQIGKRRNWKGVHDGPLLSWEQILSLQKEGIAFGSHTCTHRRLTELSSEEARNEMIRSKLVLEERLGRRVEFLSYPFGDSDHQIQKMAEEIGYSGACGVLKGKSNRFNLIRREVHTVDSPFSFRAKLTAFHRVPNLLRRKTFMGRLIEQVYISVRKTTGKTGLQG